MKDWYASVRQKIRITKLINVKMVLPIPLSRQLLKTSMGIFGSAPTINAPLKDDTRFFVCGRGVIVNLEHAEELEGIAFRMADGSRVFVSQDLLKSARQAFMEFLLQRGRMV